MCVVCVCITHVYRSGYSLDMVILDEVKWGPGVIAIEVCAQVCVCVCAYVCGVCVYYSCVSERMFAQYGHIG
jgi:hypothetical protein